MTENVKIKYYKTKGEKEDCYWAEWEWNKSISENKNKLNGTICVVKNMYNPIVDYTYVAVKLENRRSIWSINLLEHNKNIPEELRYKNKKGYNSFSTAYLMFICRIKNKQKQEYIDEFAF